MTRDDLLTIGAFAAQTGLSVPALRHYDDIGLLAPAQVDATTGYRRYAPEQEEQARLICSLRAVDLPIEQIRDLIDRSPHQVRLVLDTHRQRLAAQIRALAERVKAVEEFLEKGTPTPPPQTIRPVQLRITVADIGKAVAFYTAAFDVTFHARISSLQFGTYRTDRFFLITLRETGDAPSDIDGTRFGLLVDDLDAAHQRALDAGASEHHPPTAFTWKPRTSCLRDPSNNLIDLTQA